MTVAIFGSRMDSQHNSSLPGRFPLGPEEAPGSRHPLSRGLEFANRTPQGDNQHMPVYLCRWPNGDFSIVSAGTKSDAIVLLDEWGNAEQAKLWRMEDCMFDFRLNDEGEIVLAETGEATYEDVMEKCYPVAFEALCDADFKAKGGYTKDSQKAIRKAVKQERDRLWKNQPKPKPAATELGRKIQEQTGAPAVLVDRVVKETSKKILESDAGEDGEPN